MKKHSSQSVGIAFGIVIGCFIGVARDNMGLWIALGIALGATIGPRIVEKYRNNKEDESEEL